MYLHRKGSWVEKGEETCLRGNQQLSENLLFNLSPTLCDPMDFSMPGFSVLQYFPQFSQIHIHCVGDAIQPSHPLLSSSLPALNFSQHHGFFHWVSSLSKVAKVLSFSFSISPSDEYSGLIFFSIDWYDLLEVQQTLKSFLQNHNVKASIFLL